MPVVNYDKCQFEEVRMDGLAKTDKTNAIGPEEGWQENTLRLFRINPGGFTPQHRHDWEHVNYVIEGNGKLTIDGETFELSERDMAFVPPNAEHQFQNPYDKVFEFICIVPKRGA